MVTSVAVVERTGKEGLAPVTAEMLQDWKNESITCARRVLADAERALRKAEAGATLPEAVMERIYELRSALK